MKILATMPTHKVMEVKAVSALFDMQKELTLHGHSLELMTYNGFNPYFARNRLFKAAMKREVDWILSLDSDMVCTANAFYSIIDKDKDIVSAKYYVCGDVNQDYRALAMGNWQDAEHKKFAQVMPQSDEKGLQEVDVCGFGFVAIKPEVMKKVYEDGDGFFTPSGSVFQTDDVLFCDRAKECGYKIYYDADVVVGHLSVTSHI
jgi:GT2 family glycosyltransferase